MRTGWHGSWQEQTAKAKLIFAGAALWEILLQKSDRNSPAKESWGRTVKQAEAESLFCPNLPSPH